MIVRRKLGLIISELKRDNEFRERVSDILSPEHNAIRKILERIGKDRSKYEIWFFENKKGSTKITN